MSSGCCINSVVVPDFQLAQSGQTIRFFFLLGETLVYYRVLQNPCNTK